MAEEVEISNVGDGGVASEATLASLTRAIEKLAGSTGKDPTKEAGKVQKQYNDAIKSGISVSTENRDALEKRTESTKKATQATNKLSRAMLGAASSAIGAVRESLMGMANVVLSGKNDMTSMFSQLPLVGNTLGMLTGVFDESMDAFRATSSVGASFNNDITAMRLNAAQAGMSLSDYTSFVMDNAADLAKFGGTVTQGALQVNRLNKAMGEERNNLLNMGMTYEEINEGLVTYMNLTRAGSRVEQRSAQEQAASAANYMKQLDKLAKLTGEDAKSLAAKTAAQSADVAFQMKLAQLRPEEREKVMAGLTEALALGGETGGEFFKQQILGMGPMTESTALFASTLGESADVIRRMATSAQDTTMSLDQFEAGSVDRMVNFVEGAANSAEGMEGLLRAAASGVDGPAADIAAILQGMGKQFTDYQRMENGRLVFDRQKLEQDLREAEREQGARADATAAVVEYEEGMKKLRENLITNVLNPLMKTVAPALKEMSKMFSDFVDSPEFNEFTKFIQDKLGVLKESLENFINGLKTDPEKTLKELGGKIMSSIGDVIGSALKSALTSPTVLGAIAGIFLAPKLLGAFTSGISSMFGGGGAATGGSKGGRKGGGGAAKIGGQVGKFAGSLAGGVMEGAAKGIAAFANPAIPLGAAALGAAITAIGAGIAGAAWIMGKSLPTFAEGMQSFEDINGDKLVNAGKGMAAVAGGMAAFGAGSAVSGLGQLVGNIAEGLGGLFGETNPMVKMQEFASYDIDAERVKKNAEALSAFGAAMAVQGAGAGLSGVGNLVGAVTDFIGGMFGADSPIEQVKEFGDMQINADGVTANANAMAAMSQALSTMSGVDLGDVEIPKSLVNRLKDLGNMESAGLQPVADGMTAIANVQGLQSNFDILNAGLDIDKVRDYNNVMEGLVETLSELNEVLAEDNKGLLGGGTGVASADVLGQINTSSAGSAEGMNRLNSLMTQVLTVLREIATDADQIEKNTASSGSNIANGRVSVVR